MGSADSDQFCLRWNDFQQCIKSTFQDLRDEKDFMDVTVSCDGEQVKAHKVILSACSDTFRNLLKKNPAQHPVIVLWVGIAAPLQEFDFFLSFLGHVTSRPGIHPRLHIQ